MLEANELIPFMHNFFTVIDTYRRECNLVSIDGSSYFGRGKGLFITLFILLPTVT